jgi:hypothetical protein
MRNWATYRAGKARRSEAGRRAANARWARVHAACNGEPVRESRVVELSIRDSHRPARVIRMQADMTPRGWSRWAVSENGARIGCRTFGRRALAGLIAGSLA